MQGYIKESSQELQDRPAQDLFGASRDPHAVFWENGSSLGMCNRLDNKAALKAQRLLPV